jgi:excisionase family DNA binding protein
MLRTRYASAAMDSQTLHEEPNGRPGPVRLTLTVEEAAVLLGISRNSAYEAVRRGEIPSVRIGGRIVIPRRRFLDWLGADDDDPARA